MSTAVITQRKSVMDCIKEIEVAWTAGTDGSVDNIVVEGSKFLFLHKVVTNPGSRAPADNYDIALLDEDGLDILSSAGDNRDTANAEAIIPAQITPPIGKTNLTLTISNVVTDRGEGVVRLFLSPYPCAVVAAA